MVDNNESDRGQDEATEGSAPRDRVRLDTKDSRGSPLSQAIVLASGARTEQADLPPGVPVRGIPRDILSSRHGYSTAELEALFSLSHAFLINGELGLAEKIARGLVSVAPDHSPAWLALAYIALMREDGNESIFCARQALRSHPASIEALLFLVIGYFQSEDFQTGGTFLGEVADLIRAGGVRNELKRVYDSQVLRFEERMQNGRGSAWRER